MKTMGIVFAIGALVGALLGLAAGYKLWHQEPRTTTETFRPGKVQADGSVDLTRIPTAPADAGPAPHVLPKGATETARAHLVVRPKPRPAAALLHEGAQQGATPATPTCSCDPITIDLSGYTSPGGTGMVASADGAEVDVAHSTYTPMLDPEPQLKNFALVTHEPGSDNYSGLVGKRFLDGRLGLGAGGAKREGRVVGLIGLEVSW